MTIDSLIQRTIKYARLGILVALLLLLAVVILRQLGVILPIRAVEPLELAYLCGGYWLCK